MIFSLLFSSAFLNLCPCSSTFNFVILFNNLMKARIIFLYFHILNISCSFTISFKIVMIVPLSSCSQLARISFTLMASFFLYKFIDSINFQSSWFSFKKLFNFILLTKFCRELSMTSFGIPSLLVINRKKHRQNT